jgi:photosystem II stability/assembly factor-like uncharacterized protein
MKNLIRAALQLISLCLLSFCIKAQMRQIYVDIPQNNQISKISFLTPATGFIAFTNWIGYTTDSGRTFTRKYITMSNVNYNGYNVNLTFGFGIIGIKAFSTDILIAYGNYGFVPSILYSSDGGNSFTLVYQSQVNAQSFTEGITDMIFPANGSTGFAVEADRIIKTTNGGRNWFAVRNDANSFFKFVEAINDNTVYALSDTKLLKSSNGGSSWTQLATPAGTIYSANFLTENKGWINVYNSTFSTMSIFYTSNGGVSWILKNVPDVHPVLFNKIKFIDDSTGYAIGGAFNILKTTDSGKIWQRLPRDNNYSYLGYTHNDLSFWNTDQFWAGGGHGFLELSTNGGGRTLPTSLFRIDTTGVHNTQLVKLVNYSKSDYQYNWYKNNVLISASYNASYTHDIYNSDDTIKLVVIDGLNTDTSVLYQHFIAAPKPTPPTINLISPLTAGAGAQVTIRGVNFTGVTSVKFGGTAASSYTIVSNTEITAIVGAGATGSVEIINSYGTAAIAGFTFTTRLGISSFSPRSAPAGASIVITGTNFDPVPANNYVYIGRMRAEVLSASVSTLVVKVPTGAAAGSISVTVNGAVANSYLPFNYSFDGPSKITASDWAFKKEFKSDFSMNGLKAADLDNDGKTDIVSVNSDGINQMGVMRNTSFQDSIYFKQTPATADGSSYFLGGTNDVGDLDGDGKLDVIIMRGINIYRNTSSSGSITFAPVTKASINASDAKLIISDFDGDGKQDFIGTNSLLEVRILQNTGSVGSISFVELSEYTLRPYGGYGVKGQPLVTDIDGDNKPDIVQIAVDGFYVYLNTSLPGTISFARPVYFSARLQTPTVLNYVAGDLDGDNKPDLIIQSGATTMLLARNTSTVGNANFTTVANPAFTTAVEMRGLSIADMNGDGKPELVSAINNSYAPTGKDIQFSIFQNKSTPGSFSFEPRVDIALDSINHNAYTLAIADYNNDGRPDIGIGNGYNTGEFSIYLNQSVLNVDVCSGSTTKLQSKRPGGAVYQWQQKAGGEFQDISDDAFLSGTNTVELQLKYIPVSFNKNQYRCMVDGVPEQIYQLTVNDSNIPSISITAADSVICEGTPASFTASTVNGGSSPSYTWQLNGVNQASSGSNTFVSAGLHNGDSIQVKLKSSAACVLPDTAVSQKIGIRVNKIVTPAVSITSSDNSICAGLPVTFTATAVNEGKQPSYKWQKNSQTIGGNGNTYIDNTLSSSDVIMVTLTSDAACVTQKTAQSAPITTTVRPLVHPKIIIAGPTTVTKGQSVVLNAIATDTGSAPVYQWQDSTDANGWKNINSISAASLNYTPSATGHKVRSLLKSNAICAGTGSDISNALVFTVNLTTGIITPGDPTGIQFFPNPVRSILYLQGLKTADGWVYLEIAGADGSRKTFRNDIRNNTSVEVNTSQLPNGMYIGTLTKRSGERASFVFIKAD